ncbi:MAG: Abi-alpha family protein [Solirubrobacteraceae bacterium]
MSEYEHLEGTDDERRYEDHGVPDRVSEYEHDAGLLDTLEGVARVAARLWLRSATWGMQSGVHAGSRLARAAVSPRAAAELWRDAASGLRGYARELLGVSELDERLAGMASPGAWSEPEVDAVDASSEASPSPSLRDAGAELLRQSADVDCQDDGHPAFARILAELHPEEARVLRLLVVDRAQPSVDVRATVLMGVSSQVVSSGLNMIGAQAGCRHLERVPAYLNNLERLGLVWFSQESLKDPTRYQVLEAQPAVMDAIKRAGRAKTVRRSIHLTPFGHAFCDACLPVAAARVDGSVGERSAEALGTAAVDSSPGERSARPPGATGVDGSDGLPEEPDSAGPGRGVDAGSAGSLRAAGIDRSSRERPAEL